jgi:hypothetical protein
MFFALTGPSSGKTMKVGSLGSPLHFKDGLMEVPDDAKDLHSLLEKMYEAHPAHLCEQLPDGTIVRKAGSINDLPLSIGNRPKIALREISVEATSNASVSVNEADGQPPAFEPPAAPAAKPGKAGK